MRKSITTEPIFIGGTGRCGTWLLMQALLDAQGTLCFGEPDGFHELFIEKFLDGQVASAGTAHRRHGFALANRSWPLPIKFMKFRRVYSQTIAKTLKSSLVWLDKLAGANRALAASSPRLINDSMTWLHQRGGAQHIEGVFSESNINRELDLFLTCLTREQFKRRFSTFADSLLGSLAKQFGNARWCLKQPGYLYAHIDKVAELYGSMRFIHIVRDGRDVVASTMHQPWVQGATRAERFEFAVRHWSSILECGWAGERGLPNGQLMTVKFEDLASRPHDEMERVTTFINSATMAGAPKAEIDHDRLHLLIDARGPNIGRFRFDLSAEEIGRINGDFGYLLERYDYA